MKVERDFIIRKFREFNAAIFDNSLADVPVELTESKRFLGVCVFRKRRNPDGSHHYSDFKLKFNCRPDLRQEEIEDTLIHEMIHYYILSRQMQDTSTHGRIFRRMMQQINTRFNRHITISHKFEEADRDQLVDKRRKWHVIALIDFTDGKSAVKVLPRIHEKIAAFYNTFTAGRGVERVSLYMSDDPHFNRYPCSSALKAQYCDRAEIMSALQTAYRAVCDGRKMTVLTQR